jgi:hypothetical protein
MKLICVLLLLMLVSTIAWREKRLRSNLNGPEGLPTATYDDDEELDAEDGPMHDYNGDFGTGDDDEYFGDADLFKMRGWPDPDDDDDDDDDDELTLEDYGEALKDPNMMRQIYASMMEIFSTEQEKILSQPGQTADCYSMDYVKCSFAVEEFPVVFMVEYDEEPEEYKVTVEHSPPDAEVMRRRLTAKHCNVFNTMMSIWNREISCEIKEYSHLVSIKHIG